MKSMNFMGGLCGLLVRMSRKIYAGITSEDLFPFVESHSVHVHPSLSTRDWPFQVARIHSFADAGVIPFSP